MLVDFHLSDLGYKRKSQNNTMVKYETSHMAEEQWVVGKLAFHDPALLLTSPITSFLSYAWPHLRQLAYFPFLVLLIMSLK